jgi:FKBP-type peptidyl-prolyl cis-trans isomerase 2
MLACRSALRQAAAALAGREGARAPPRVAAAAHAAHATLPRGAGLARARALVAGPSRGRENVPRGVGGQAEEREEREEERKLLEQNKWSKWPEKGHYVIEPDLEKEMSDPALFVESAPGVLPDPDSRPGVSPLGVAALGCRVLVNYRTFDMEGNELDSSFKEKGEALEFVVGHDTVLTGVENAVVGMRVGEVKWADVPARDAFGERVKGRTMRVPMSSVPEGIKPGEMVMFDSSGQRSVFVERDGDEAVLDLNHPMAGQPLRFELELVSAHTVPPLVRTVLEAGRGGTRPVDGDEVEVEYHAFVKGDAPEPHEVRGVPEPMAFVVGMGAVIRGLDDAVREMTPGEIARLEIPMELGYFHHGASDSVPPYTDLVFDVKLVSISKTSKEALARGGAISDRE